MDKIINEEILNLWTRIIDTPMVMTSKIESSNIIPSVLR